MHFGILIVKDDDKNFKPIIKEVGDYNYGFMDEVDGRFLILQMMVQ